MPRVRLYGPTYGRFGLEARAAVRIETYGEDLGQNSWLLVDEWRSLGAWLAPEPGARVLDVGCGSGGPILFLARERGAEVVGVDANEEAVATAQAAVRDERATFVRADGAGPLPFGDAEFDAVVCIDALNHLPDRASVLAEWHRALRPGGRLVFTDPVVVTGLVSNEELAARSSIGFFLFSTLAEDERLVREAGFELEAADDTTGRVAEVAGRWHDGRAARRDSLAADEGDETFDGLQRFLAVTQRLAAERRLSRYTFRATR